MKKKLLILCTGNSARSQMAEGIVRKFLGDRFDVYSAGLEPSRVNPFAVRAMAEIGIDISHHRSKHLNEFANREFDLVITVCADADKNCPVFPGKTKKAHIGFPDPANVKGTDEEILNFFRKVRDDIKDKIINYLTDFYIEKVKN